MTELLGMTLDEALAACARMGISPEVTQTAAPRHPVETGALRVVRVQDGGRRLTCTRVPELTEECADDVEGHR